MTNLQLNIKLVVFSVVESRLKTYLTGNTLPSGLLEKDVSVDRAAEKLFDKFLKISREDIYSEQLYTFSFQNNQITVVYYFLVPDHKISSNMQNWVDVESTKINKIDHKIIFYARQRLQWKIEYTNAVFSLLPREFTFSQLQSAYEAILGKTLDKRNFRKKILSLNILKDTGHLKNLGKARPAEMFAFKKKKLTFVEIL